MRSIPENPIASLSAAQTAIMTAYGAALWFAVAMLARTLDRIGAFDGGNLAIVYALVVPATPPLIWAARYLARLHRAQTVAAVATATAAASLLDGIALAGFPQLYGTTAAIPGALILWGVGVALALALAMSRPTNS